MSMGSGINIASRLSQQVLRNQIVERRSRLENAAAKVNDASLQDLFDQIDAALHKIDHGSYGYCETCLDPIEEDRLAQNPLVRFCLDHMNQAELEAHQQDIDLAAKIQTQLLPPRDLSVDSWDLHYRYQPVGAVGGDYCELILQENGNSLFFAVGDVSGKGVAASLLMTHLSAIFRSLLSLNLSLSEIMIRANRLFCDSTAAGHYATLVCGRASAGGFEICNAGHCPPILLRRGGIEKIDSSGLPLGLFCGVEHTTSRVTLEIGDCLVLYSDGITESQDLHGNEFGESRLMQAVMDYRTERPESMAECVLRDIQRFRHPLPSSDDETLLILRRRG